MKVNKKVIVAIDPGVPKSKDNKATTGIYIGHLSRLDKIGGLSIDIHSTNIDAGIQACANKINSIIDNLLELGYEVIIAMEEYKNYEFNAAANNYSKNETSQLIGAIKTLCIKPGVSITMQSTSQIKSMYSDITLIGLGLLNKNNNRFNYPDNLLSTDGELNTDLVGELTTVSSRHERDAYRHYLLCRRNLKYINKIYGR